MHVFLESNCRITGGLDAPGVPSRFVGSSMIYALYMPSPNCCVRCWTPSLDCFLISAKLVSASLLLWTMPPPNLLSGASSSKHVSFSPPSPFQQFSAAHSFADLHSFLPYKTLLVILILHTYCNLVERGSTLSLQPCVLGEALKTTPWMAPTFSI